jgi:hypothetical protein
LPEITSPFFAEVDLPRITPMGLADSPPQAVFRRRDSNQMRMVGHQAIAPNRHSVFAAPIGHQFQVGRIVSVVEKCLLSPIASLRYMMGHTRNDQSRQPRHARNLPDSNNLVNI